MRIYLSKLEYLEQATKFLTRIQMLLYDSIIDPVLYESENSIGLALYNILSSSTGQNNSIRSLFSREDFEDSIGNFQHENYVVYHNKYYQITLKNLFGFQKCMKYAKELDKLLDRQSNLDGLSEEAAKIKHNI